MATRLVWQSGDSVYGTRAGAMIAGYHSIFAKLSAADVERKCFLPTFYDSANWPKTTLDCALFFRQQRVPNKTTGGEYYLIDDHYSRKENPQCTCNLPPDIDSAIGDITIGVHDNNGRAFWYNSAIAEYTQILLVDNLSLADDERTLLQLILQNAPADSMEIMPTLPGTMVYFHAVEHIFTLSPDGSTDIYTVL